jgi:hypothetical protein
LKEVERTRKSLLHHKREEEKRRRAFCTTNDKNSLLRDEQDQVLQKPIPSKDFGVNSKMKTETSHQIK